MQTSLWILDQSSTSNLLELSAISLRNATAYFIRFAVILPTFNHCLTQPQYQNCYHTHVFIRNENLFCNMSIWLQVVILVTKIRWFKSIISKLVVCLNFKKFKIVWTGNTYQAMLLLGFVLYFFITYMRMSLMKKFCMSKLRVIFALCIVS